MPNGTVDLNEIYTKDAITAFKGIDKNDINLSPFLSYKSWTVTSGSATSSALPLEGIYSDVNYLPALGSELTYNDSKNIDNSLQTVTYFSINHLFYKRKENAFSSLGSYNLNQVKKFLYQSASILSFPGKRVGLYIKPKSFNLTTNITTNISTYGGGVYGSATYGSLSAVSGAISLKSDKYGNIYDTAIDTSSFISSGLVYYEGFNEYFDTSRINILNYSSSGVTYVPGVTATDYNSGSIGYAAKFDGNGFIKQSDNIFTGRSSAGLFDRKTNFAISFYISASTFIGNDQLIICKGEPNNPQYPFKIQLSGSGVIKFSGAASNNLNLTITSSILSAGWNHVVCQKSGSYMQIYTNAVLNSTGSNPAYVTPNSYATASGYINNTDAVYMGGFNTNTSNLTGYLDEIRIFNKSLTTSNISALSNRSITGSMLQTNIVGTVYKDQGLAVISSPNYLYNNITNTPYTASYRSTIKTTEMSVVARVKAGDLNMSNNATLLEDDLETFVSYVSSSVFTPYVTTIGLYSPGGDLMAVAKLAQPVKKRNDVDLNFLIRIDLDQEFNI